MVKNKKVSRVIRVPILACALLVSGASSAQLLNFNIPDNIIQIINQVQEVIRQIEDIEHQIAEMTQSGELFNLGIENENNAAAATVAYRNEMDVDRHTADVVLGDATPDKDACKTVSSAITETAVKKSKEVKRTMGSEANKLLSSSVGMTESEQMEKRDEINTAIIGACEQLQHTDGPGSIDSSICLNTDVLYSGNSVMTEEQSKAADMMIKIVNDVNVVPTDPAILMQDTAASREAKRKYMKKVARRQIATDGMKDAVLDRQPLSAGISHFSALLSVDEDRFGDASWLSEVANADPSAKNEVLIETIARKQLALDAFSVHMMMESYRKLNSLIVIESAQLAALNDILEELSKRK